ncbi:hypothetical protein GGS23DRAFT_56625 [Durotheca rogersii]|uniref:uncharacterized protein n=1 Tax=Durotheca rogersii TaxID=419775 RepID=UPI00222050BD|nr:uncharacterized protein GGS23DRAFT_56625 [Durotheca rogersii]KAI5863180.1 hypothetical protein GGS23DRAFT_56625 [Durotheca rogersii]
MATALGKRKLRAQEQEPAVSQEEAQAIFRRHFEAQFAPLEVSSPIALRKETGPVPEVEDLRSDSDSDNDSWAGVSGPESDAGSSATTKAEIIEVVSHTRSPRPLLSDVLSKRESKAYLSSRPPPPSTETGSAATATAAKRKAGAATMDEDAPSLLRNDLELQRLLSESHLFSSLSPGDGAGAMEHTGRNRHLATDLRLAALGSKASIYRQAKMPMAHRKGIVAAAGAREARRRREARENGIVLERPAKGGRAAAAGRKRAGGRAPKRQRPVDAPAVGTLRNGMLKLSRKDISAVQSDGLRAGARGGKKRRR